MCLTLRLLPVVYGTICKSLHTAILCLLQPQIPVCCWLDVYPHVSQHVHFALTGTALKTTTIDKHLKA